MKTGRFWGLILVLIVGFSFSLQAQNSLDAIISKLEKREDVKVSVLQNRNKETKQLERIMTEIVFSDHPEWMNEFMTAYESEKTNAFRCSEEKRNGELYEAHCRFDFPDKEVTYLFEKRANRCTISKIERYSKK